MYKPIEGSDANPDTEPDELILDGQQRLTSLYNALYSKKPVHTKTDKGKEIDRYYYLDIEKAIDPAAGDDDVVISIPSTRQVTSDFGRKIDKDAESIDYGGILPIVIINCVFRPRIPHC